MDKEKQMKYFSEVTKSCYDTEPELVAAEQAFLQQQNSECSKDCDDTMSVSDSKEKTPTRKQLANNVEQAEQALKDAYKEYDIVKVEIERLSKEYLAKVDELTKPAQEKIKQAEANKYQAISEFNKYYGGYQTIYTGARAAEELLRALNMFDRRAPDSLFKLFF